MCTELLGWGERGGFFSPEKVHPGPPAALSHPIFVGWEGALTKIDVLKKKAGTKSYSKLSNLEDLATRA